MLLKKQCVNEEIKKEIKKYLQTNNNEDTHSQNIWDDAKAVLRGKFIVTQTFQEENKKRPQIDSLTLHLKKLRKRRTKKT